MANSTFGDTSQALLHAASTSALQIISSSTTSASTTSGPAVTEWSAEGEPAGECVSMNDLLWHYRQDLTTRPLIMGLFAICYSVIIFLGIVGNICVILAISRTRSLQTVPNMFIFSLSCSDVVVCCTSATITPITAFQKEWLFGTFLCSVAPFIAGVSLCFSTFTLAAISLDRFMLIRFPMKKPFSHVQAFSIICLICVLAMAMSVPVMFMQTLKPLDKYCGQFCYEDWGANANQRRAYGTLMLTLQFIIPLVVIVFCYTAISLRLGQSVLLKSKKKQQGSGYEWQLQMSDQQRTATKRRQRTNRMFIAMVVAFSLSWIWTLMFNLLRDYEILPEFVKDQEFFFGILTHCIAMTSTVWNPFVYAFLNLQLRAAFWQLMPQCLKQCLETKISDEKAAAKNGGPVQTMNLSGQQGRERANKQSFKRRQSSPVKSARRFSQKPANVNGGLLLATGELRPGHRDYEEDSTASINLVEGNESPITTATSALMEPSLVQNSGNANSSNTFTLPPLLMRLFRVLGLEQLVRANRHRQCSTTSLSQTQVSRRNSPSMINGQVIGLIQPPVVIISSPQQVEALKRLSLRSWSIAGQPHVTKGSDDSADNCPRQFSHHLPSHPASVVEEFGHCLVHLPSTPINQSTTQAGCQSRVATDTASPSIQRFNSSMARVIASLGGSAGGKVIGRASSSVHSKRISALRRCSMGANPPALPPNMKLESRLHMTGLRTVPSVKITPPGSAGARDVSAAPAVPTD